MSVDKNVPRPGIHKSGSHRPSIARPSIVGVSALDIRKHLDDSDSDISRTSFKRWHKHMQNEHLRLSRPSFSSWKCCYKLCRPCRWFDSISYEKKISKCCLTFRTFKTLGTIVLVAVFFYILTYSIFKKDVLPGGTIFFLFILSITAYITGYVIMLIGLPAMLGHLVIGIIFENLPENMLPKRDDHIVEETAKTSEKILLIIALIRAGLLLDMSKIKNHVWFIIRLSLFPFISEFLLVWITSHFLLHLPWEWSALQGSVMSVVSLASVTSIMQKNKHAGLGEDKDLCTILIAAAVLNVVFGLFAYVTSLTYTLPDGGRSRQFGEVMLFLLEEVAIGLSVGLVAGLLISFFPDKRNVIDPSTEAAALRILVLGIGSFAIANILNESGMVTAAGLSCLTMCVTATNMWEELGWHKENNPVQYFYTVVYYFSQPVVLSLLGYTMNFKDSDKREIGMSVAVLLCGLLGREVACYLNSSSKSFTTTFKEKIFISVAWISKGTFQILLSSNIHYIVLGQKKYLSFATYEEYLKHSRTVKETTVVAILLTTPLVFFTLTLLSPVLLTRHDRSRDSSISDTYNKSKKRPSFKHIRRFTIAE